MKTTKSWWEKLCEFTLRRRPKLSDKPLSASAVQLTRSPVDPEANDKLLAQIKDGDPVYRTLMDYAYELYEDNTAAAMNAIGDKDKQNDYLQRAAAMREYIGNVETAREQLKGDLAARQQRAAAREAKQKDSPQSH